MWVLTLVSAGLLASVLTSLDAPVRRILGATLDPQRNPPPSVAHVLVLFAHNLPPAAWPLLLGVLEVHRHRPARQAAHTLVVAVFAINVLTVGAALGVYGVALLPYIPQIPFEWAALALGASAGLMQSHAPLKRREGTLLLALIAGALLCAAVFETIAVPHR